MIAQLYVALLEYHEKNLLPIWSPQLDYSECSECVRHATPTHTHTNVAIYCRASSNTRPDLLQWNVYTKSAKRRV